jgi:hypothetical protein
VTDENLDGKIMFYGEYSSINPWVEDGLAKHYREPGELFSTGNYKNGKIVGEWIYYYDNNKVDTVEYLEPELVEKLIECPYLELLKIKRKVQSSIDSITNSISNLLTKNFHLSARASGVSIEFQTDIIFIIDTNGRIKCLKIPNFIHDDINKEIYRILNQYRLNTVFEKAVGIRINFRYSQSDGFPEKQDDMIYSIEDVEEMPKFIYYDFNSNMMSFRHYVAENIEIPSNECDGTVYVDFIIEKDGSLSNINIKRGIDNCNGYVQEIEKVFSSSPLWIPAKHKGSPVRTSFFTGISFYYEEEDNEIYYVVEQMPQFNYKYCESSVECFRQYIADNLKVPSFECDGRVYVEFIVEKNGRMSNIKIVREIDNCNGYEQEVERVFSASPLWRPGFQKGEPVRVKYTVPILFAPNNNE